jgi:hypothetical protein
MNKLSRHPVGRLALYVVIVLFASCEGGPNDPVPTGDLSLSSHGSSSQVVVKIMTRNIYHGASLTPLFAPGLPAGQVPIVAAQIWSQVLATNFPDRAEALADEIATVEPELVGLQEVALYRMQVPGDAAFGGTTPATDEVLDFLEILLSELAARGLSYQAVVSNSNIDAEVPMFFPASPTGLADIRLTDFDVILARDDVSWSDAQSANFVAKFPVQIGPITLFVPRGWSSVDVTIEGRDFRFVNTHLEAFVPAVQVGQAQELLAILAAEPLPTALVGDFNSEADGSTTPTYGMVVGAGFTDAWEPRGRGFTCCHAHDLLNPVADLDQRIDFVFLRGDFGFDPPGVGGPFQGSLVGHKPSDRSSTGLWPSDHVGVATRLQFLRGPQ